MKNLETSRKVILFLLITSFMISFAEAIILSYFGVIVGEIRISQSVQISKDRVKWLTCTTRTGEGCTLRDQISGVAGDEIYLSYYIKNNANEEAKIGIDDSNSPVELDELSIAVVDVNKKCDDVMSYEDILGSSGPYLTVIQGKTTMKVCERLRFKVNSLPNAYTLTLIVLPQGR